MKITELFNRLEGECDAQALTLYEYSYSHLDFGSWFIVLGNSHHRIRFSWDGKESALGIAESEFINTKSRPEWRPLLPGISSASLSTADVLSFITKKVNEQYSR